MKPVFSYLAWWLVSCLLSLPAFAQSKKIVLCGVHWPPFTYVENERFVKGISYDLYRSVFNSIGYRAEMVALPWQRCLDWARAGKVDAVMDNTAVKGLIHGATPSAAYPIAVFVREHSPYVRFNWQMVRGQVVGMVKGYDYPKAIMEFQGWERDYAADDAQVISKLVAERYDFALLDMFSGQALAKQQNADIRMLTPGVASAPLYLTFHPKHQVLMRQFDAALRKLITQGKVDQIYRQYSTLSYQEVIAIGKSTEVGQLGVDQ